MSLLLPLAAPAATLYSCATYDNHNKYFVVDGASRASVQKRVLSLCQSRRLGAARCRPNLTCQTLSNRVPQRLQRVVPFPSELRLPAPGISIPSQPQRPSRPPEPSAKPARDKSPGQSCKGNSGCYSYQFCAGGSCFEKSGAGGQSCKKNNDCYPDGFCVSGQCFPKTGDAKQSCKKNGDCYPDGFCVSGQCFEK